VGLFRGVDASALSRAFPNALDAQADGAVHANEFARPPRQLRAMQALREGYQRLSLGEAPRQRMPRIRSPQPARADQDGTTCHPS